jgi:peptidoglycan/xylan/chitin deacetylase (PgdA/CDA1 family)
MYSPFSDRHPIGAQVIAPATVQPSPSHSGPTHPLPIRTGRSTSITILQCHRAQAGPRGNAPAMLDAHFSWLATHCNCVLPGEKLVPEKVNVCVTFDDAYFDFYSVVWPLLRKHKLRAVLGVAPDVIRERALFPDVTRTNAPCDLDRIHSYGDGFCTWPELSTLAASGQVIIAAQSHPHRSLSRRNIDLGAEIVKPQEVLSSRLNQPVDSFVLPNEEFSGAALRMVREHYRYAFGGGQAVNRDWSHSPLYRRNDDEMTSPNAFLPKARSMAACLRPFLGRIRFS